MKSTPLYCSYYQAHVPDEHAWFLVAIARSWEHVAFDRTLDSATGTFEFFVPPDMEEYFLAMMRLLADRGVVVGLARTDNRLARGCGHDDV